MRILRWLGISLWVMYLAGGVEHPAEAQGFGSRLQYYLVNYPHLEREAQWLSGKVLRDLKPEQVKGFIVLARYEQQTYDKMLGDLTKGYEGIPLVGMSGDWHRCFADNTYLDRQYITLMPLLGEGITCKAGLVEKMGEDPEAKGRQLGEAVSMPGTKIVLVFVTGGLRKQAGWPESFLKGLRGAVGNGVVVLGTVAPDGEQVFCGRKNFQDAGVALAIAGKVRVEMVAYHPYEEIGRAKATRVEGRRMLELDGKAVGEVYRNAIFALPRGLKNSVVSRRFPFGEQADGKIKVLYQGTIQEDGTYEFEKEVKQGQEVLFLKKGEKPAASYAEPAVQVLQERLQKTTIIFMAQDIYAWSSYQQEKGVLAEVWKAVAEGGHLLGWFGQGTLTSLDGARCLTNYLAGIAAE